MISHNMNVQYMSIYTVIQFILFITLGGYIGNTRNGRSLSLTEVNY